jgi:hypothetical protein
MLSQEALLKLDPRVATYVGELSRRRRDRLGAEILELFALLEQHGAERLIAAMAVAQRGGACGA